MKKKKKKGLSEEDNICYSRVKSLPRAKSDVHSARLWRMWGQGSEACVVAVYPLSKSSLHQRPVYQHHLEKNVPLSALPTAPRGHSCGQRGVTLLQCLAGHRWQQAQQYWCRGGTYFWVNRGRHLCVPLTRGQAFQSPEESQL